MLLGGLRIGEGHLLFSRKIIAELTHQPHDVGIGDILVQIVRKALVFKKKLIAHSFKLPKPFLSSL